MGVSEGFASTVAFLRRRKLAYQLTMGTPALVGRLRTAYRRVFLHPAGQNVMIDLAKFCRANQTCFDADPRLHAVLEGRREVWLRIQNHLRLNGEQLFALYAGQQFPMTPEEQDDGR